jgi:hypothetical protein
MARGFGDATWPEDGSEDPASVGETDAAPTDPPDPTEPPVVEPDDATAAARATDPPSSSSSATGLVVALLLLGVLAGVGASTRWRRRDLAQP